MVEGKLRAACLSIDLPQDLPQVYFVNEKIGEGKIRKGKSEIGEKVESVSSFTVSSRLITDDEIDLGQI